MIIKTWLKHFIFIATVISSSAFAKADELFLYGGTLADLDLGGCCTVFKPGSPGLGGFGRFDTQRNGRWTLGGYSNSFWTEGYLVKSYYVLGSPVQFDTGAGELVSAKTVSNYSLVSSIGGGVSVQTARTKTYDLPTVVNNISIINLNQFSYRLNDKWALSYMLELNLSFSSDNRVLIFGNFLGLSVDF